MSMRIAVLLILLFLGVFAYKLQSINVIRKYSQLADIAYSWLSTHRRLLFISDWESVHKSQVDSK